MKKFTLIIGIDISKASLHVSYQHQQGKAVSLQLDNQAPAIAAFLEQMLGLEPDPAKVLLCCEHTGTYGSRLALAAKAAGVTLWMVHPLVMRHASADLSRYKTDKADAAKIRSFAHTHLAKATNFHHPSAAAHQLRLLQQARKQLVGLRQQLLNMITDNKDKAQPLSLVGVVFQEVKAYLTQAIRQIEQEVGRLIASDASLRRMHTVLLSIPGIGPVTSIHLLAVTDRFTRFPGPKALACFVGTAPFPNQSGSSKNPKARVSKKAYQPLKVELHQGALSVSRKGLFFHDFYQHLAEQKHHHLDIINRIINQMINLAFTLIRKDQLFDKKTYLSNKKSPGFLLEMS
jgi:transposase